MTVYAVYLGDNRDPDSKVKSQYTDVGKTLEECTKAAELFVQTSYYDTVQVVAFPTQTVISAHESRTTRFK